MAIYPVKGRKLFGAGNFPICFCLIGKTIVCRGCLQMKRAQKGSWIYLRAHSYGMAQLGYEGPFFLLQAWCSFHPLTAAWLRWEGEKKRESGSSLFSLCSGALKRS